MDDASLKKKARPEDATEQDFYDILLGEKCGRERSGALHLATPVRNTSGCNVLGVLIFKITHHWHHLQRQ
jgi:hypothetical protein